MYMTRLQAINQEGKSCDRDMSKFRLPQEKSE